MTWTQTRHRTQTAIPVSEAHPGWRGSGSAGRASCLHIRLPCACLTAPRFPLAVLHTLWPRFQWFHTPAINPSTGLHVDRPSLLGRKHAEQRASYSRIGCSPYVEMFSRGWSCVRPNRPSSGEPSPRIVSGRAIFICRYGLTTVGGGGRE